MNKINGWIGAAQGSKVNKLFSLLEKSDMSFFWGSGVSGFSISLLGGEKTFGKGFSLGASYSRTEYFPIPKGRAVNFR